MTVVNIHNDIYLPTLLSHFLLLSLQAQYRLLDLETLQSAANWAKRTKLQSYTIVKTSYRVASNLTETFDESKGK